MVEALTILTSIAVVLLAGIILTIFSRRILISNVLILIVAGMLFRLITHNGKPVFEFSSTFLISISTLALVMITFDGASRFKLKEVDKFSGDASRLVLWFTIMNIILLTTFTNIMFFNNLSTKNILFSLIFAIVMAGTDPGAVFSFMKGKMLNVIEILEIESIINTPIIVLIPFIILDFITASNSSMNGFIDHLIPFLRQIIVGIGAGVVVGIIIFKAMKDVYHYKLSPLAIITATLLSYVLAENLGGNGVLSVATMGLVFGNIYVKKKLFLQEFSSIFSGALQILVFILVGFIIEIDLSLILIIKSIVLFSIMIIARWLAINIALQKEKYKVREKMFMTLNLPKGIAVATVIFSLSIMNIPELNIIIDLILLFIIYSVILSSIVDHYSKKFININLEED
ncbi:MAG: cation:proton antiporter [Nanoarchaeota archaeon]|nr:cation:proton antiporter [Nanoarchaeota archaeon]MBU1854151.1 cation:proton antiporter [Nanoarchaeota archaeon]